MDFRVLGVLEALDDGLPVSLGGPKQRSVLAMLLLDANHAVSIDHLINGVWGDDPPAQAAATLQVYISNLRKVLEPDRSPRGESSVLVTQPSAYVLAVDPEQIDAKRFERLLSEAQSALGRADAPNALRLLDEGLGLWRGPAWMEFAFEDFARPEAARLDDLRLVAVEERVEARLALGEHAALVGELEGLVGEHPLRERLWGQLMRALYRDGRQAEALRAYARLRRLLGEELGIEPSGPLRSLEEAMVLQRPELDWTPPASRVASPVGVAAAGVVLPSGTVTFLFTDFEASARLWEEHRDHIHHALARLDKMLRDAVTAHDGHMFKATGDGVHAVFANAVSAVGAAVDVQRALGRESWEAPGELRVRMGIDSGGAEFRGGDYPGPVVNKGARIASIAHGGQVLVSSATAELVQDRLSDGVGLVDLGAYRLRDLSHAERLFQLRATGLREAFPPLAALDATPNNLPVQLTSFIGRESEIAAVAEKLEMNRLVTLTGSAGCGKTRLALQVGAKVLGDFADGVWLVELAALTDPALVLDVIASSWSIPESTATAIGLGGGSDLAAARTLEDVLVDYLRPRSALLILDNCEHLLAACASFAARALRECGGLRILATSREPLGVEGETTRRVPSLSAPDALHPPSMERIGEYEAVRLFVDRAARRVGGFAPTDEDAVALAQICYRLDGIPLAIELAAARVQVLSLPDIANRLDDQFQLLTGGSRTALERHQTLRAALDWSYDLLTEPEQVLLARLSVFAGGFSLEAAEAICSDETVSAAQVLDLLEHLVDRSLVDAERTDAVLRYRLLESIRQYGNELLARSGDADTVRMRHRDYFASFAADAQRGLWGPESPRRASGIDLDLDNIRAAIVWSLVHDEHEAALQIVTFLDMYWFSWMTRRREGLRLFEQCLERAGDNVPPPLLARSLGATSFLNSVAGDLQRAFDTGEQATALYRQLGDKRGLAMSLNSLARAARDLGRLADAQDYAEEAVEVGRAAGFAPGLGSALVITGSIAQLRGDLDTARSAFHEVLASRDRQVPGNLYESLHGLGLIAFADGATDTARQWFEEAVKLEPTVTAAPASATFGLAVVALATGDTAQARRLVEDALDYFTANDFSPWPGWPALLGDVEFQEGNLDLAESLRCDALERLTRVWNPTEPALGQHLMGIARLALARGNASRAAVLIGAGDASRQQLGVPSFAFLEWEHPSQAASAARAALGHSAYTAAWETGNSMTPEQAVNFALERPD